MEIDRQLMPNAVKRLLLLVLMMLILAVAWRYLINAGVVSADKITALLNAVANWQQLNWFMPVMIILYVILLSLMFPLTLLVIATGFLFDPVWAMLCATAGTLSSSAASFFIGHYAGREAIEKHGGGKTKKAERFMRNNATYSMIVINLLPIAPFTLTNMLAGAFRMQFIPYMTGSAIGIIPGLLAVILVGGQLGKILQASQPSQIWQGVAVALLVIGALSILIVRISKSRPTEE